MDLTIRPMTEKEHKYSYTQDADIMNNSGCIGHLRGDMDSTGIGFFASWDTHNAELKTDAFKEEFDQIVNALRFDEQYGELLKNRSSLSAYCHKNAESRISESSLNEFGFRADTEDHSYMIRCNPDKGNYNFYIYAYDRELLDNALEAEPNIINVLVVEPGKAPYEKAISDDLKTLQASVGGFIEAVYPYEEPVAIICNEEGKINGLPLNRALRDEEGHMYDIIAGTFLITGLDNYNFGSLPPELVKQFTERFASPELFVNMNGRIVVVPIQDDHPKRTEKASVLKRLNDMKENEPVLPKPKVPTKEER